MKRIIVVMLLGVAILSLSGCATMFGNEKQYDRGDWYLFAGSYEVARIKQDKLALKKLESQQAVATEQGYRGKVANLDSSPINIIISGPEKKSYLLAGNQSLYDYLIPGDYIARRYRNGHEDGKPWPFYVGTQKHSFMGEEMHWYVYNE